MLGFSPLASAPLADSGAVGAVLSRTASIASASTVSAVASVTRGRAASIVAASTVTATATTSSDISRAATIVAASTVAATASVTRSRRHQPVRCNRRGINGCSNSNGNAASGRGCVVGINCCGNGGHHAVKGRCNRFCVNGCGNSHKDNGHQPYRIHIINQLDDCVADYIARPVNQH